MGHLQTPVSGFVNRTVKSYEAEAKRCPEGENATVETVSVCPSIVRPLAPSYLPVVSSSVRFQSCTVARAPQFYLHSSLHTALCFIPQLSVPLSHRQGHCGRRQADCAAITLWEAPVLSLEQEANNEPSGEKSTHRTIPVCPLRV